MFHKALLSTLILAIFGGIHCDNLSDTPTQSYTYVDLSDFRVEPTDISFDVDLDGFKDTTLHYTFFALLHNSEFLEHLGYIVRNPRTSEILIQESLEKLVIDTLPIEIQGKFSWETTTTSYEQLLLELYALDRYGYRIQHQAILSIEGIASSPPKIIWVENPNSVEIPTGSTTLNIPFQAKVTDPDGQETLDRVFIAFENEDGSRCTESVFTVCKTRYEELGYPRILDIKMNLNNGCFESYVKEKPKKKETKVVKYWNDIDD